MGACDAISSRRHSARGLPGDPKIPCDVGPGDRVRTDVAVADTSDGFYSVIHTRAARRPGRLFARQFGRLAADDHEGGAEWIDTKPRSFDTDTWDRIEETT